MGAWLFVGVSFTLTRLGEFCKLTGGTKEPVPQPKVPLPIEGPATSSLRSELRIEDSRAERECISGICGFLFRLRLCCAVSSVVYF